MHVLYCGSKGGGFRLGRRSNFLVTEARSQSVMVELGATFRTREAVPCRAAAPMGASEVSNALKLLCTATVPITAP